MTSTTSIKQTQLNTIEEAINDIRDGKVIIVVDDENRENEGDFLAAAEKVTPDMINFMATHGRGLICTPLTENRCKELQLNMMVNNNTDPMETAFTVSVDLRGKGVTTGISASDRALTIQALIDKETKPFDLARPGHIFPLKAKEGGVLRRTGHTEAAIDFARLAGLQPAGVYHKNFRINIILIPLPAILSNACHKACMTNTKSTIRNVAVNGTKNLFKMYLSKIFIKNRDLFSRNKNSILYAKMLLISC